MLLQAGAILEPLLCISYLERPAPIEYLNTCLLQETVLEHLEDCDESCVDMAEVAVAKHNFNLFFIPEPLPHDLDVEN